MRNINSRGARGSHVSKNLFIEHINVEGNDERSIENYVLAVTADMPALELVAAVPIRLKIAAPDNLESIVGSALPGVPVAHMPQVSSAIPVRPNTFYFSLSAKNPLYQRALEEGTPAVYAPDGMPG